MSDASAVSTNVDNNSTNGETQPTFVDVVAKRVRERAAARGLKTPKALADRLRMSSSSVDNYWNGKRPWPLETVPLLAMLFETSTDWLLGSPASSGGSEDAPDLVAVTEIDLAYGLGGTFADADVQQEIIHFERNWLESITRTPAALLTFARGRGDSMQPTVQDGDIVLIDRSVRTIREADAIWALTIGDIAMIKRVRPRGEQVMILSDNERVPPDEYHHEELNIVGRVIFIGRRI